eukprot:TRINITY_DN3046_c0_g1_i9.p1 TRINITY_DN3046_c0_g1~~TRINITY_DN3046_c0_g1_i9.p1  ORF type:complete len:556 (-),score=181.49 TRINITY_DN3046_c0_g1_i9:143-1810(-)
MLSRLLHAGGIITASGKVIGRVRPLNLTARTFFTTQSKLFQFNKITTMARAFGSYPEHKVLDLPNLSPTMTKGNIVKWYKKEGDSVAAGDIICDVETDKATVGYEMADDGVMAKILVEEGAKDVPLGTPVAVMVTESKDVAAFKDFKPDEGTKPAPKKEKSKKEASKNEDEDDAKDEAKDKDKYKDKDKDEDKDEDKECKEGKESKKEKKGKKSKKNNEEAEEVEEAEEAEEAPKKKTKQEAPKESKKPEGKICVSPSAKKFAAENNVDLSEITGSGPNGRILKEDVVAHMEKKPKGKSKGKSKEASKSESKKGKAPSKIPGMPEFDDIDLTNYKRVTAERLTEAKQTVPHFYVSVECEVDKLLTLRSQLNKIASTKITINDMLIKACALACLKVPVTNSSWMGDFIRKYKDVDMSVAVQTPNGLITPIVPRANQKGFEQIANMTKELIAKAKDGKLKPEEFIGGTFTISNAGMYGISQLIPIVNPPQACILGVSAVEKRLVVDESKRDSKRPWRVASRMTVSLSCDHRVVDGAGGAEWTQEFKKLIENPALMML